MSDVAPAPYQTPIVGPGGMITLPWIAWLRQLFVRVGGNNSSLVTNPMTGTGDLIYGDSTGAPTRLAGSSSNTRKFLRSVASGGLPTAPAWDTLQAGDIPALTYVTSVALSLPNIFTISGSPVTSSGTLTGTFATQSANTLLAGPISGAAAAPTFRALVAADIPGSLGSSLVLISSATASSSATIDFTSLSNSSYDAFLIEADNVLPATNGVNLILRVSVSGTFQSGAGDYSHQQLRWVSGGSGVSGSTSDTGININSASDSIANSGGTNPGCSFQLWFFNPAQTSSVKRCTWMFEGLCSAYESVAGGGSYLSSANAVDGFRFLMSSGNISTGTFRLYGVKNA